CSCGFIACAARSWPTSANPCWSCSRCTRERCTRAAPPAAPACCWSGFAAKASPGWRWIRCCGCRLAATKACSPTSPSRRTCSTCPPCGPTKRCCWSKPRTSPSRPLRASTSPACWTSCWQAAPPTCSPGWPSASAPRAAASATCCWPTAAPCAACRPWPVPSGATTFSATMCSPPACARSAKHPRRNCSMSEQSRFALPYLAEIFGALSRGRHLCLDDGNLFVELREHEREFEELFQHLGYQMIADSRGFYYFHALDSQSTSPRTAKLVLFFLVLVEALWEESSDI